MTQVTESGNTESISVFSSPLLPTPTTDQLWNMAHFDFEELLKRPRIKSLKYLSGIVGSGKTTTMIEIISNHMKRCVREKLSETIVVSCISIKLIDQTHQNLLDKRKENGYADKDYIITALHCENDDNDSRFNHVYRDVEEHLERKGKPRVILCTHNTLARVRCDLLDGLSVYLDELPEALFEIMTPAWKKNSANGAAIDKYMHLEDSPRHKGYQIATLREDKRSEVEDILSGHSVYDEKLVKLLDYLYQGYAALYANDWTIKKQPAHAFKAIHYMPLQNVLTRAEVTLCAATVEQTTFAFVVENILKIPVEPHLANFGLTQKHKHKIIIIPIINAHDVWSKSFKESVTKTKIENYPRMYANKTILQLANHAAKKELKDNYFITANKKDTLSLSGTGVVRIPPKQHGINTYRHYTKGVWLASMRASPLQTNLFSLVCSDINHADGTRLNANDLIQMYQTEKSLEAAYQFGGRGNFRNPYDPLNPLPPFIFVVPDLSYAEYIANKFEDGCFEIRPALFELKQEDAAKVKEKKTKGYSKRSSNVTAKTKREVKKVQKLIAKGKTQAAACKEVGITVNTYKKYKDQI